MKTVSYAVLTSSDSVARGSRDDAGGQAVVDALHPNRYHCVARRIKTDDVEPLSRQLREWSNDPQINLIFTTGGTGLGPRDVTPEATSGILDYEVPGISEAIRSSTLAKTRMAMLSRAVAGVCNRTLIVNLPGSPKGVAECIEVIHDVLPHAIEIIAGTDRGNHPG